MARRNYYEDAQIIDYISKPDGLGGVKWEQVPGAPIRAGFFVNNSNEAVLAGRLGNKAIFTIQTDANVELEQNDVVLRKADGRMYRVTSNASDMTTPAVALDQYREVTAEVLT
jgi:hypothetical protein